jgi:hypothetical protein
VLVFYGRLYYGPPTVSGLDHSSLASEKRHKAQAKVYEAARVRLTGYHGGRETPQGYATTLMRALIWVHIFLILTLVGFSTYSLFKGNFEAALWPSPVLILYYIIFVRRGSREYSSVEEDDDRPGD